MSKEHAYLLPFEAMVAVMQESPEMISLHAELVLPTLAKEPCVAELLLGQGTLYACTIRTRSGHLLTGHMKEAYTLLQQQGDLEWSLHTHAFSSSAQLTPERPFSRQTSPPPPGGVLRVPRRTRATLPPAQMHALAYAHRQVFHLTDGTKTIGLIARLLTKSPEVVTHILQELQNRHLITW